ncbi:MAG: glycosyltransferase [Gloeocapsa sp. UFS-A4-WI-NPMV-4B04]|jgi:glycosyltransferase involved in cell wall biosynthesis|nr:glycosyltransferase [Gloeocapsa sp. UFS-A4-WI-NPMV-4B04]
MNSVDINSFEKEGSVTNPCLRVLFVSHTYVVGVNQGKLNAIAATGTKVGLLVPSRWKALAWDKRFEIEKPYPEIHLYPARVLFEGRVGAYLYPPGAILRALRDFRPDIIQVEQEVFSLSALEMALWARFTGKPLILFCWENMERHLSNFRQWSRQFILNTAKLIIAGNQEGAALLRQWGYQGQIEVMAQMGVDTSLFAPRPHKSRNSEFLIGYVGRLAHHKGIDILLAAIQHLRDHGHYCRVVLCGTGPDEEALRQEAQRQKVADLVIWRGGMRHDEVPEEMSKFDVLVLPSRTVPEWKEQFGHVLIEAMAMGIPAIGSSCGEIPNVVGRPDLVFPEGNAERLAAILERMICDSTWCEELEQYSITRVSQHYTHERIAERLLDLWRKLLNSKSNTEEL